MMSFPSAGSMTIRFGRRCLILVQISSSVLWSSHKFGPIYLQEGELREALNWAKSDYYQFLARHIFREYIPRILEVSSVGTDLRGIAA